MKHSRASHEPTVEAVGLTKVFPGRRALFGSQPTSPTLAVEDINLRLGEGEIFGLIGPNGAGKTTLIKLLTTLLTPTSGTARIAGLDVIRNERQIRRLVGLVTSNERSFYWRLTGRQNLTFFASLYDLEPRESRAWIDELFDLLGLGDKADVRFDSYSTGMKQRLAFARGLLGKPRFLFMDEPTKGVDPVSRADLVHIMEERIIERWNPTILITSHNLSEIERLCGRIALMAQGRFIAVGTLDELRTMAPGVDRFDVLVRNLPEERMRRLAAESQAAVPAHVTSLDGALGMTLEFPRESDGFSAFVRGVVRSGGDLVTCTSVKQSFDDVFQDLLDLDRGKRPVLSAENRAS